MPGYIALVGPAIGPLVSIGMNAIAGVSIPGAVTKTVATGTGKREIHVMKVNCDIAGASLAVYYKNEVFSVCQHSGCVAGFGTAPIYGVRFLATAVMHCCATIIRAGTGVDQLIGVNGEAAGWRTTKAPAKAATAARAA